MMTVIGVDMGATNTRVCAYYGNKIVSRTEFSTAEGDTSPPALLQRLADEIRVHVLDTHALEGIGLVLPGLIDPTHGMAYQLPNVPGWEEPVAVADLLEEILETPSPVFLGNDANAGAMAEHFFGGGKGFRHMVYLTVSTGIGGGVYVDDSLHLGRDGCATELGHITIQFRNGNKCNCGGFGHLESHASGTAIERMGKDLLISGNGPPGDFQEYLESRGLKRRDVTAIIVADAARAGVLSARHIIDRAAEAIGFGLGSIANIYNPEIIILGGGVMNSADLLMPTVSPVFKSAAMAKNGDVPLVLSTLGEDRGLLGAVALVLEETK